MHPETTDESPIGNTETQDSEEKQSLLRRARQGVHPRPVRIQRGCLREVAGDPRACEL